MEDDWKVNWESYLKKRFGDTIPEGPFKINFRDIDFYIPPLLATNSKDFGDIKKMNAKKRIF